MNEEAARILLSLVSRHGTSLAFDPLRCEALLRDTCPRCRQEIFVLVNAVRQQIPADLLSPRHSLPPELFRGFLKKRLEDELAFSDEAAQWAVDTWAAALGAGTVSDTKKNSALQGALKRIPGISFPEDMTTGKVWEQRAEWARQLESGDPEICFSAIHAMGDSPDTETIRLLIIGLENPLWRVREAAFDALVHMGEPAVPPLIEALGDSHEQVVTRAVLVLGALRAQDATEPLIALLETGREWITAIVWALGEIGNRRAITPLTRFLNSSNLQVASEAEAALKKFG
ncbi:HEAT repeat domain-containing protein [Methanoregula sp.]|uniref:HEAT repeat domain-containing protein n=1 Tax=Methanoregula sp. TaxID=2052170 RepID=UPI00260522C0|nr:HEAT repeat domain-containing protein [Methanoregula sp.]MDD5141859.1 HEAT repeat domain-containing protein [Methanoregula sp.]